MVPKFSCMQFLFKYDGKNGLLFEQSTLSVVLWLRTLVSAARVSITVDSLIAPPVPSLTGVTLSYGDVPLMNGPECLIPASWYSYQPPALVKSTRIAP